MQFLLHLDTFLIAHTLAILVDRVFLWMFQFVNQSSA